MIEVKDLLKKDSAEVRRNPDLMLFYVETFTKTFGYAPSCAGCTFTSDWRKLSLHFYRKDDNNVVNLSTNNNSTIMKEFKFKIIENVILKYVKDGRTFRAYDNSAKLDFVLGFLTNGTDEELAERKKLFSVLPELSDLPEMEHHGDENRVEENEEPKEEDTKEEPKEPAAGSTLPQVEESPAGGSGVPEDVKEPLKSTENTPVKKPVVKKTPAKRKPAVKKPAAKKE
jgi:hypothetical protein